jgi:hypothetical protein
VRIVTHERLRAGRSTDELNPGFSWPWHYGQVKSSSLSFLAGALHLVMACADSDGGRQGMHREAARNSRWDHGR